MTPIRYVLAFIVLIAMVGCSDPEPETHTGNSTLAEPQGSTAFGDWIPSVCAHGSLTALANGSMPNADLTWFCRASNSPSINIAVASYRNANAVDGDLARGLPCYYFAAREDSLGATWVFVSTAGYGPDDLEPLTEFGFALDRARC